MAMKDPINKLIMQEIGLTTNIEKEVIDEETRLPIVIKDKVLKYSSSVCVPIKKNEMIFDPANNRGQMSILFDYFVNKLETEGTEVDMYYDINDGSAMEVKIQGQTIRTNEYNNDQLRYLDMMRRLNQSDPSDIRDLDDKRKKKQLKSKKSKVNFNK